jgi:hypothetical protein
VVDTQATLMVPVAFKEDAIAEDLTHHPPAVREALDLFRREIDCDGGLSLSRLKQCDEEGRDGTRLAGCVKTYVPWPTGRFGLVLLPVAHPTKRLALRAFAYGIRHPAANKPSVYQISDQRHNAESA